MIEQTARWSFNRTIDHKIRKTIQGMVKTMIPGIVQSYDPKTKRAEILPAIRLELDNEEIRSRAMLLDVPVVSTSTGGVMVHHPIEKGDIVMVLFSERGIGNFKKSWKESDPNPERYYHVMDAVAIRWGLETMQPVDDEAFIIQSKDGKTYFKLKDGLIEMRCGRRVFRMNPFTGRLS